MKTWLKIVALILLLGALAGYFLVPRLIRVDRIQAQLTTQLSEKLGQPVQIESVRWHWFPLPYVGLYNTRLHYEAADLVLPEARLYPDWFSLFGSEATVSKIVLKRPEITLRIRGDFSESLPEITLPRLKIAIDGGILHVQSLAPLFGVVTKTFDLTAIAASARLSPDHIALQLNAKATFSKSLSLKGDYALKEHKYALETRWEGLHLHQAITSTAHGTLIPLDSAANFQAKVSGTGTATVSADLEGELPCFLYKPKNEKVLFDCGLVNLHLDKIGNEIAIAVKELAMDTPGLHLSGTIKRTVATEGAEPIWRLDLVGKDLDVGKIRKTLLTLYGDNPIVRDLFNVVRGGTVKTATYTFNGRAADFEYLKYQVITAEAADAIIHIPAAKLTLEGVNGRMRIEGGTLFVTDANGRLGKSKGKNCSLKFNLLDEIKNPPFSLDVDIDADATDLVRTLYGLIPYEDFRRELSQLSNVEGTGSGHLRIGPTLQNFGVGVNVTAMDVKGRYGRLASPFHIRKGTMQIEPHRVSWAGIVGNLGNHQIRGLTGSMDWEHEPLLHIDNINATLDGKTLLSDLSHYKAVADYLAPILTSLAGTIQVTQGTFEGPPLDYEKWHYTALATLKNLSWTSPLLDGAPVTGHSGELSLSDKAIKLSHNAARFQKSNLNVDGTFQHQLLANWQGTVDLSGNLAEELGPWLRNQGWLPYVAQPRLPAKITGMHLDWNDKNLTATGTLVAGGAGLKKPPQLTFNVRSSEQNPLALAIEVVGQAQHGRLQFDLLDQDPETFRLGWQGELTAQTLKRLIANDTLFTGAIKGNCTITVPTEPAPPSVVGQLSVTGCRLPLDETAAKYLDIRELKLAGGRGMAMIQRLVLGLTEQEQLTLAGEVHAVPGGLTLALNLTSPQLTKKTAEDFLEQLKKLRSKVGAPEKADKKTVGRAITGTVRFDLDKFISGPNKEEAAEDEGPLIWSPIKGVLTLKPHGRMSAEIETAKLCCLDIKGTWVSDPVLGVSHFSLATTCPTPPKFEEVLPCVGIKQNVVQGEFLLNADLFGVPSFWHHGRATITSGKGRILRMKLLSKVFSVVNLTDLFTSDGFPNFAEKGFAYSELLIESHIKENELIIDKAMVRGEGLNLFARGKLNLGTHQADITLLIAPFKTIDTIVGHVPLVGRVIGGREAAIITIPVGIKGDIRDPDVTVLAPDAVGEGLLNLVKNTLLLPFRILSPILPGPGAAPPK